MVARIVGAHNYRSLIDITTAGGIPRAAGNIGSTAAEILAATSQTAGWLTEAGEVFTHGPGGTALFGQLV